MLVFNLTHRGVWDGNPPTPYDPEAARGPREVLMEVEPSLQPGQFARPTPAGTWLILEEDGEGRFVQASPVFSVPKRVGKYRFMFELFADIEQLFLDAFLTSAQSLTQSDLLDPAMDAQTQCLVVLRNAWQRFQALEFIELDAPATIKFLECCKTLGVFGVDLALADLRIASIRNDEDAPSDS